MGVGNGSQNSFRTPGFAFGNRYIRRPFKLELISCSYQIQQSFSFIFLAPAQNLSLVFLLGQHTHKKPRYINSLLLLLLLKTRPFSKCVTEPNLVALGQTVWVQVGSQNFGNAGAPLPYGGVWLTLQKYAPPTCYLTEFGLFRSNGTSVITEIRLEI